MVRKILVPVCLFVSASPALAQAARAVPTSSPNGVTAVRVERSAESVPATTDPGAATPSAAGLRWTNVSPQNASWMVDMVGVGDDGTQVWGSHILNLERITWTSTTEDDALSPQPILDQQFSSGPDSMRVDAPAEARGCAVTLMPGPVPGSHELFWYDGLSTTAAWSVQIPVSQTVWLGEGLETSVSADGRWVTAGYNSPNEEAEVQVFDTWSPTPTQSVATFNFQTQYSYHYREHQLSGDGARLLLSTWSDCLVYDVAGGAVLLHELSGVGGHGSGQSSVIDFDGDVFGKGGNEVTVWVEAPGGWTQVVDFVDADWETPGYWAAAVSADGSTFAAAGSDVLNFGELRLHVWSIDPNGTATKLWNWSWDQPSGSLMNAPAALSISDDGGRIAFGAYGAGDGTFPEFMVFDRDQGPAPIASIDIPGSVLDVEISGDGQFAAVGTKAVHASIFGNGGELYCLDLGGQTLQLFGTPSVGETVELRIHAAPGELALIALGLATLPPATLPGLSGALEVLPQWLEVPPPVGVDGSTSFALAIPSDASLIGADVFAQSVTVDPPQLTGSFQNRVKLALTP